MQNTPESSNGDEQTLREKNLQLTELQLYINNITRCPGTVVILFARRKDHQLNTLIKCSTLLQFYYL